MTAASEDRADIALKDLAKLMGRSPIFRDIHSEWVPDQKRPLPGYGLFEIGYDTSPDSHRR